MSEGNSFLDISRFEKIEKIGEGGFGKVFKVKNKSNGEMLLKYLFENYLKIVKKISTFYEK